MITGRTKPHLHFHCMHVYTNLNSRNGAFHELTKKYKKGSHGEEFQSIFPHA